MLDWALPYPQGPQTCLTCVDGGGGVMLHVNDYV